MFCVKCGAECEDFEEGGILRQRCMHCGYIHYKNPYPCIAVLVVNDFGQILLGKRGMILSMPAGLIWTDCRRWHLRQMSLLLESTSGCWGKAALRC